VVGPIVALLDVSPELVLREFGSERAFSWLGDITSAITEIDSGNGQPIERGSFGSCTKIDECIRWSARTWSCAGLKRRSKITRLILIAADVQ
jgi:hypothetical protein